MANEIKLIGVSGKINSGKDAVGSMLRYITEKSNKKNYSVRQYIQGLENNAFRPGSDYQIRKFADVIKITTAAILGVPVSMMEDRKYKATGLGSLWTTYHLQNRSSGYSLKYPTQDQRREAIVRLANHPTYNERDYSLYEEELTPRRILQLLGTEAGKRVIHENIWVNASFAEFTEDSHWIFTDVRFPNEVEAIESRGGIVINILRDHVPACLTPTEVFQKLQSLYHLSDVTSGEFIDKVTFNSTTRPQVIQQGIDEFLSWDGSPEHYTYIVPHESETALDNHTFKYTIQNGWSYDDLYMDVMEIIQKAKDEKKANTVVNK